MVTGEKQDEQIDWSEVFRVETPLQDMIDELSIALFGCRARDIPEWMRELNELEYQVSLPKRLRKRRASLRRQRARMWRLADRAQQRRVIGIEVSL